MSTDEEAVLALESRRVRAMNEADPEALLALLHDDHVHVMANGVVTDKKGAAESLRNVPRKVEMRVPKVRIYGDLAVLTGPQVNHEQINGQPMTIELFVTRVARRANGAWKFVSMQATRLPG
jgi:ketosteroid isomerase-like protein